MLQVFPSSGMMKLCHQLSAAATLGIMELPLVRSLSLDHNAKQ